MQKKGPIAKLHVFHKDDLVLLKATNLQTTHPKAKLAPQHYGPFKVLWASDLPLNSHLNYAASLTSDKTSAQHTTLKQMVPVSTPTNHLNNTSVYSVVHSKTTGIFFFGFDYCAPRGTEPHVALRVNTVYMLVGNRSGMCLQ